MTRRLWSSLSKRTQAKYKRNNISPQQYNSVKFRASNPDVFRNASRGRAPKSYSVQRAEAMGLGYMVHDFDKLTTKVQRQLADAYMNGPMQKNAPIRATTGGGFEFAPIDDDPDSHHFGETRAFDDTVMSRFRLFEMFDEIGKGDMTAEDWKIYRSLYSNHF